MLAEVRRKRKQKEEKRKGGPTVSVQLPPHSRRTRGSGKGGIAHLDTQKRPGRAVGCNAVLGCARSPTAPQPSRGGSLDPNQVVAVRRHPIRSWRFAGTQSGRGGSLAPNQVVADACARTAAGIRPPMVATVWHDPLPATTSMAPNWRSPTTSHQPRAAH